MKKEYYRTFVFGLGIGLLPLFFVSTFLNESARYQSVDDTSSSNQSDTVTYEDYIEWMKGVQGDLTDEEYHDLEVRCYFDNLYHYAKDWNVVDSAMTFEEFLRLPICNEDSIELFCEESK